MNAFRLAQAAGGLAALAGLVVLTGVPPLDPFLWMIYLGLAGCGALFGGAVVLAWNHLTRSPRVRVVTAATLLVLALPPAACYQRRAAATPAFLARADSAKARVLGRNIFGNLLLLYRFPPEHAGRMIAERKRGHGRFEGGDSIWVYRQREPPHRMDVWPPGPDLGGTLRTVLWLWAIVGVLVAGYGPLLKRSPDPERAPANRS